MKDNGQHCAALLIIDVQRALFEKSTPIYQATELLQNLNLLISQAHQTNTPVIFVQHANDSFLVKDSEGWQLHPALTPDATDLIIHKQHGSALQDTPLQQELQSQGIQTLIVTGLVTHGCVKATCQDAKQHGYRVILVEDGHSNYHKQASTVVQEWNQKLSEEGIELISAVSVDFQSLA